MIGSRLSLFVLLTLVAMWGFQPAVAQEVPVAEVTDAQQAVPAVWQTGVPAGLFFVHQRVDGHVVGQIGRFDAAGNLLPVQVGVHVLQQGTVVQTTWSDERGWFQAVGLRPGVYSVVALGEAGLMAYAVRVLPYDPEVPQDELLLYGTLIPPADMAFLVEVLCGALEPECLLECAPECCPTGGGGCGGFFGGGGGGGGGGRPATPHRIHLPDREDKHRGRPKR